MAYFIFVKPETLNNNLYRIAKTDTDLNYVLPNSDLYKVISVTDDLFNSLQIDAISVTGYSGDNPVYETNTYIGSSQTTTAEGFAPASDMTVEQVQNIVNSYISFFEKTLQDNPNNPLKTEIQEYVVALKELDCSTVPVEYRYRVNAYLKQLNKTIIHTLQIA